MNKATTIVIAAGIIAMPLRAMAEGEINVTFDFTEPETLTPPVAAPAQKESVPLDGYTFTQEGVEITFHATGTGNTQVRLYGSYDAGCNLRVYDGDSFTVSVSNPEYVLGKIVYDTALTGTTADVDLSPDTGHYEWLENTWTSTDDATRTVTFHSILQSRISTMTVTLAKSGTTAVKSIPEEEQEESWYTIDGKKISIPNTPGLYILRGKKVLY